MSIHVLYRNNRQFLLHAVSLLTIALSVFVFWMIFSDLSGFWGEYTSRASGIAWMMFFLVAGNSMMVCMLWLSGRYVLQINETVTGELEVETWDFLGLYRIKIYPRSILSDPKFHYGRAAFSHVPAVNAPWWGLKTPRGKTLVVDLQGTFFFDWQDVHKRISSKIRLKDDPSDIKFRQTNQ